MSWRNVDSRVHFPPHKNLRPKEEGKEYFGDDKFWMPGRRSIIFKEGEKSGEFLIVSIDADESHSDALYVLRGLKEMNHPFTSTELEAFRSVFKFRDLKLFDTDKQDDSKPKNLF